MKRLCSLPILAALCVCVPAAAGDPPTTSATPTTPCIPATGATADQAVACVQGVYDRSQTFQSDFSQKFWVKAYNTEKSSHGHVQFAKPGKMSWTYDDEQSRGNRVVSDGTTVRVYEASNKQMYESPLDKSQYPAALSFLTGTGKLADAFVFTLQTGQSMNFPGGVVLVGTPKTPTPAYSKVLFYVDLGTAQVRRVMIIDGQGNRNRFDFEAPRVNETLSADLFKYTPPPGTSIIHP